MGKVNAIILAGDRRASIRVRGQNKAFIEFRGRPLFLHVLSALQDAEGVDRVVVIGPVERLQEALRAHGMEENVDLVAQRESMIDNFKAAYVASLGVDEDTDFWSLSGTEHEDTAVLVVPCDLPLLTGMEVDEFIRGSNMHEYDYSIGITSEKVLSYYHPQAERPGVKLIYFHVKEDLMRHNNLHLAKPLRFQHLDYIEKMYEWRYQTRFFNIMRMLLSLLLAGWRYVKGIRIFILMQLSLFYDRQGHPRLSDRLRSCVGFNRLSDEVGHVLGARTQIIYTHYGGAALDVDNERDLDSIDQMYEKWMAYQHARRE